MAAVPVTITGVLFDKYARTSQLVTLMGEATITGLGVGGGPIPPGGGVPVDPGWGIPPGGYPHPSHPIYNPAHPDQGLPGQQPGTPPGFWGGGPHPGGGPIYPEGGVPPIPTEPPPDGGDKPPPEGSGGWGFVSEWSRWGYFPNPNEAQPK